MKKIFLIAFLLIAFIAVMPFAEAKIWTVDNSPGAGADSTSLNGIAAIASAGDTIIVMPSLNSYGSISINKKLFVYSRGITSNTIDKDKKVDIASLTINANGKGSVMKGLYTTYLYAYADDVLFENCYSTAISCNGSNNLFLGCIIENNTGSITFANTAHNNIFSNCFYSKKIISGSSSGQYYPFVNGGNSTNLFKNCNFMENIVSGSVTSGGYTVFNNSYVKVYNNIIWSNHPNRSAFDTLNYGSVFKNNLTYSINNKVSNLPGNSNFNDTVILFEGGYDANNLPFYRASNDMRLKSTSVGKFAGTDSTDIGIYGGNYNFSFEGNVPGVAVFDDFEILNPVVKKGGVVKVKATARKPE